jgi:hypothetical protein
MFPVHWLHCFSINSTNLWMCDKDDIFTFTCLLSKFAFKIKKKNKSCNGNVYFSPCGIAMSLQNQVSWIRKRDFHILSSGDALYTNDARFVATHEPKHSTYTLQIKVSCSVLFTEILYFQEYYSWKSHISIFFPFSPFSPSLFPLD